jgi:hypothetical protein
MLALAGAPRGKCEVSVAELSELEQRVEKLEEKKSFRELVVGSLFGPLLVALVTGLGAFYIQYIANRTQAQLDTTTKQIERMKVAQQMVADLFSDNEQRALATEKILTRVLDDDELEQEISRLVAGYYKAKVDNAIAAGKPEQASVIVDSAKQVDSDTAKAIVANAQKTHGAALARGEKRKLAAEAERQGFAALQAGNLVEARKAFGSAAAVAPDYHNVSEIVRLVDKALADPDTAKRRELGRAIFDKYSFRMEPEVREELREQQSMAMQAPVRALPPPSVNLEAL